MTILTINDLCLILKNTQARFELKFKQRPPRNWFGVKPDTLPLVVDSRTSFISGFSLFFIDFSIFQNFREWTVGPRNISNIEGYSIKDGRIRARRNI